MNNSPRRKIFAAGLRWLGALLVVLLPVHAPAQPTQPQRWLLVFDLSSAMKQRLPATEAVLKNFLATSAGGRLQAGDYIGVWTYDKKLHTGQCPLIEWDPMEAALDRTNLVSFLRSRKFSGSSRLATLQPALSEVVSSSERLTIIIFCDGQSEISSTPYDHGINQNFLAGRAERKKSRQPFVVLMRTLSGKSIGCTVNYPPGAINIPLFLAPAAPTNLPPPVPLSAPVKPPVIQDLIIIGTNVSTSTSELTNLPLPAIKSVPVEAPKILAAPAVQPAPTPESTNPVHTVQLAATNIGSLPPAPAVITTNRPSGSNIPASANGTEPVSPQANNLLVVKPPAKIESPQATPAINAAAAPAEAATDRHAHLLLVSGISLLAALIGLVILWVVRLGRRPQSSLISRSMEDDPRRK